MLSIFIVTLLFVNSVSSRCTPREHLIDQGCFCYLNHLRLINALGPPALRSNQLTLCSAQIQRPMRYSRRFCRPLFERNKFRCREVVTNLYSLQKKCSTVRFNLSQACSGRATNWGSVKKCRREIRGYSACLCILVRQGRVRRLGSKGQRREGKLCKAFFKKRPGGILKACGRSLADRCENIVKTMGERLGDCLGVKVRMSPVYRCVRNKKIE